MKSLLTFYKMNTEKKKLIVEALFYTGIFRFIILVVPMKKIKKYLGEYNKEEVIGMDINNEINIIEIEKIKWAIENVAKHTFWESKCLVQAMTGQKMLNKRKMISTLYLGIKFNENDEMKAHSWLRSGRYIVTGGYNLVDYKIVGKFLKRHW